MYKFLGVVSMTLLFVAMALSFHILKGHHSKRHVFLVSGSVFAIMIMVTVLSIVIYAEYHP